ncbi:uncharacterized protein tp53i13 [Channa argus]|uniref:uncharacterized protein tp53i13 n=1 Tax=Channa argus TaxID=215402 RepID=UPI0029481D4F|nr:hypothetical protein Q8A73_006865 [Channa argus]
MPRPATSKPLTMTVLAALWVSAGRCRTSESSPSRCDNGKLSLDKDLPMDGIYWDCPVSTWPASTQRLPSIDTVYDPDPAKQICMDKSISYNHTIPSSGAYRPVMADSGEYLYCPPQRWLNNLHHGATVLLYHPCAPLRERLFLSVLSQLCLQDYILTTHQQLNKHMPIALVSWGHTLELSSVASLDICDWLETTTTTKNNFDGMSQSRKYNLLLTWPVVRQQHTHSKEHSANTKESLRRCCEQTISSMLNGAMEAELESNKKRIWNLIKEEARGRHIRAAIRETQGNIKDVNEREGRTEGVQNHKSTLGPPVDSPPGKRALPDSLGLKEAAATPSELSTLRSNSLVIGVSQSQKTNHTARLEALALASRDEGTDLAKHRDKPSDEYNMKEQESTEKNSHKDITAHSKIEDNVVIDVKERELQQKQTHSGTHPHHKTKNIGFNSVSKSQLEAPAQAQLHLKPNTPGYLDDAQDCDGCKAGENCICTGSEGRAAVLNKGLPRTPRTDEAVWAAAALGFLLVLLTLSVLHTRLYRHWRTMPSLYWHDPRQDYDSVADVIRRRLRIAKRRRKRGRRQECVLLPSSSSSDEHL